MSLAEIRLLLFRMTDQSYNETISLHALNQMLSLIPSAILELEESAFYAHVAVEDKHLIL
jgi:hypothetical protein